MAEEQKRKFTKLGSIKRSDFKSTEGEEQLYFQTSADSKDGKYIAPIKLYALNLADNNFYEVKYMTCFAPFKDNKNPFVVYELKVNFDNPKQVSLVEENQKNSNTYDPIPRDEDSDDSDLI